MGEAKRRAASDSSYGIVPKKGFGLVVSPPIEIEGTRLYVRSSNLDPQELRFSLLFWDRLVWPDNNIISIRSDAEATFLESVGILSRPQIQVTASGQGADLFAAAHMSAFKQLSASEPGLWSIAQGESSLLIKDKDFAPVGGTEFGLYQAIPVPDKAVPLDAILEFKAKRREELLRMRIEMDAIYTRITERGDETGFKKAINEIELACVDVLKVAKESNFPLRLVDVKQQFNVDLVTVLGPALAAYIATLSLGLGQVAALAAGLGSLKLTGATAKIETGGLRWKPHPIKSHPFRYVSFYHDEVFA